VVGNQDVDEALGVWYPSHQAFLNLMSAPASSENMQLRALAVEHADPAPVPGLLNNADRRDW
jgi:hypothetical protein